MADPSLSSAFDRAERALDRVERATAGAANAGQREAVLRGKISGVIADLDEMIRTAAGR